MAGVVTVELLDQFLSISGGAGFTADGGYYVTLINKTGAPTQKGQIVQAGTVNNSFVLSTPDSESAFGIVFESGIADGESCKVVVSGKAYALLKNGTAGTAGQWCGCSDVAGRMYQIPIPSGLIAHDKEIGHSLENVTSGTDKLGLIVLHFR